MKRDVIYVDVDDEITTVIDKVKSSKEKVVALVLPKRPTVFQSIVNMKLLKKSAQDNRKNIVLVTSESSVLALSGVVGMHIAKTLQSQPAIPKSSALAIHDGNAEENIEEPDMDPNKPIGVLAGLSPLPFRRADESEEDESIEIDNEDKEEAVEDAAAAVAAEEVGKKGRKSKKIKVPNFEKFRLRLILAILALILIIVGFVFAAIVLPKATITIKTNTSSLNSDLTLNLDTTKSQLDTTNMVLPAKVVQIQKSVTSPQVNTTGHKQVGSYATGTITVSNPDTKCFFAQCSSPADSIPSGTVFTDPSGNYSFTSNSTVTIPASSCKIGQSCGGFNVTVSVTADAVGSSYNINAESGYTSAGSTTDGNPLSSYNMSGSDMTGGNSQTVQAVTQQDIQNAQNQLPSIDSSQVKQQLQQQLQQQGLYAIIATYSPGTPSINPSADVDAQANTVTVTETITYTMFGVSQNDLNTLINGSITQQINPTTQSVLNNGLDQADFTLLAQTATTAQVTMQASATIGPKLDIASLKRQIAGKQSGDIQNIINPIPGVAGVNVHFSPFWVSTAPTNLNKITIKIVKANGNTP